MSERYNPGEIEPKWQQRWLADELYKTAAADARPKYYVLDFYPYPSGDGLSVGHARNYVPTDVIARFYRMRGYNVMHPMGFDAFGLPTENAAIKLKANPHVLNEKYSANYIRQFKLLGLSYDWDRVFNSSHDSFYRWTQWIFIQIFNSWYDPRLGQARPISELETELAAHGTGRILDAIDAKPEQIGAIARSVPRIGADVWKAKTARERNRFLMQFRLAFRGENTVNWDPVDKVVVANEEVDAQGRAWRSGALVEKKTLKQWNFRITAYADRLARDLDTVNWPQKIVTMQRNWIGKSQGAEVDFTIDDGSGDKIRVYTTRPDTLWGATFMVLSPEHPLVAKITTPEKRTEVEAYAAHARAMTDVDRTDVSKAKTGVFTGALAINPVNGERIPIWVADYVLMTYGTGAIMAVPAHDQRDFDFAKKFGLNIRMVIQPPGVESTDASVLTAAYSDHGDGLGRMVNSGPLTGMDAGQSIAAAIDFIEEMKAGQRRVNYKIRDWLISRQRYWGTPIPIIHTEDGEVTVPVSELPVRLPEVESYEPTQTGESPLVQVEDWVNTPTGRRETDTMATWACSSWYFMRFADAHNSERIFDPKEVNYWLPVDMYVGGAEHAVLHLLYARMWTKVLYDLGVVGFIEPFMSLRNQGMILAPEQKEVDGRMVYEKMSKSKGNVITPDEVVAEHGADALRGYEMFISDFSQTVPWNTNGVPGVRRWLDRVWRIVLSPLDDRGAPASMTPRELRRAAHQAIQKIERDFDAFAFNTAVSSMMEFTNTLFKARDAGLAETPEWKEAIDILVRLLAPIAPHLAEELWERMGLPYSIHKQRWPQADAQAAAEDSIEIPVQVNGKLRDRITVAVGTDEATIKTLAAQTEGARRFVGDKPIRQVIYAKGRLVNIVI